MFNKINWLISVHTCGKFSLYNPQYKYILDNFSLKVNGQLKPINYLSKEMEGNVIICYFNIKDISKIKSLEVKNSALIELNSEQQNIIQSTMWHILYMITLWTSVGAYSTLNVSFTMIHYLLYKIFIRLKFTYDYNKY